MKYAILLTTLTVSLANGMTTLIDVNFPGGTGINPTFTEINNGAGTNSWTQATGVLATSGSEVSAVGAVSSTSVDFTGLGTDSLVLNFVVSSASYSTLVSNGMFLGFQDSNGSGGTALWNNHSPSFGLLLPGGAGGLDLLAVGPGGNAGGGRYQDTSYGVATVASLQDGFDVTLTVNSLGWELLIGGMLDADNNAITGGSGLWATSTQDFAGFTDSMFVATAIQTPDETSGMTLESVTLTQVPEPSSALLLGLGSLGLLRRRR
ncbi:MAG: PEP-CTERM sorting domain-containing protein [Akkermansiaceae bacterium]